MRAGGVVRAIAKDQRGVAVVLGLVALLSLTALVLAFLSVSAFEPTIAANLAAATQARYVAEAGIEAAFDGLATTPNWSDAIAGATCTAGAIAPHTVAASPLPGLTAASGTFTVRVRNDCFAGSASVTRDRIVTGLTDEDAGGATTDTNNRLMLVSTGTVGSTSKTVKAVIRRMPMPPFKGALSFLGAPASVDFGNAALTITGVDTRMGTDAAGVAPAVFGIAIGDPASVQPVKQALAAAAQTTVSGKSETTAGATASGGAAVAHDASLTLSAVTALVNALRGAADISIVSTAANPYAVRSAGASCTGSVESPTCFGTPSHPKVVHVKGDGTGSYRALDISGSTTGTGILIVEDGTLDITGTFRWNGPVIVTGRNARLAFHGGSRDEHTIWGAVVINETSGVAEPGVRGNATLAYSAEAIDAVVRGLGGRRFMSLYAWQEH